MLKERSLRRTAARIVAGLSARYIARRTDDVARTRSFEERARQAARAATRIEELGDDAVGALARKLHPAARRWADGVSAVLVGRDRSDRESAAADPSLSRYRTESAIAGVAPGAIEGLLALTPDPLRPSIEAGPLAFAVRAIVRAAAGVPVGEDAPERFASTVSRAAIATLVDELLRISTAPSSAGAEPSAGALRELEAFAAALSSP